MRQILVRPSATRLIATAVILVTGCANSNLSPVSLVQRGTLAKPEMQFDSDPAHAKIVEQTYVAREAASGGRVTGGGGCGCTM